MKKNIMFLALAAVGLASCNGGFKKGEDGLLYNIHTDKSGPKIKIGDFVTLNLTIKTDGDSVLYNTYDSGQPLPMLVRKGQFKGDVLDGLQLLAEGDSATFKVVADSAFKKGPKPPGFKGKYLVYTIKIEKLLPKGTQTDPVFQGNISTYMKSQTDALKDKEPGKIKKYIEDNKLTLTTAPSGLQYVITQPGTGAVPSAHDTVYVNYVGKLTSGKVFDTNIKDEAVKAKKFNPAAPYKPISFPVGEAKVIPGWDQGLLLLNKGAKAIFIIPSSLAYRDMANGPIAAYTPLVFEVEMVNIKHPDPNAPKPVAPQMTMPQPAKK